jgi:putative nucleotidyltransferase with HDIG domain
MITTLTADRTNTPWRKVRFDVLEHIERLPSLNSVVVEFLALARAEFFTAKDFEVILSKDQALVARLLKVANCGLYGRSRTITSIPEAVVLIGLENLKKIVYAVSAEGMTRNDLIHYDYHTSQGFWHHAMGVGHTTRIIAEASPVCRLHGEEGFVAGLLHDVGKLIIDEFLETMPGLRVSREEEAEAVGLDHAELAEYILRQWNLPDAISASVRFHHDYRSGGEWACAAAALSLAQGICGAWGIGRKAPVDLSQEVPYPPFLEVMDYLEIKPENWDRIIWDVSQSLVKVEEIFGGD